MENPLNKLKFGKGLEKKKITLIALASLLMLSLDIAFIMKTQLSAIMEAGRKIAKTEKDFKELTANLAAMRKLQQKKLEADKTEAVKTKKLISEEAIPLLLQDITELAKRNNIRITQMKPSKDTKQKEEAILGVKILPVTVTLDLSGGYHSLGSFINSLEDTPQFMAVQEMKFTRNAGDYLYQDVKLVLITYVRKSG